MKLILNNKDDGREGPITTKTAIRSLEKNFKDKIGRAHLTSINNYIVTGSIFDVHDDLWIQMEEKRKPTKYDKKKKKID